MIGRATSTEATRAAREDWREAVVVNGRQVPSSVQSRICHAQTLAEFRQIERELGITPRQFMPLRRDLLRRRWGI